MTDLHQQFRDCLETLDIERARHIWWHLAPHWEPPLDDAEMLATLHLARTASSSVRFRHRAWSHRWLSERGLPSSLPDRLRRRAERIFPTVVEGVGIAVLAPERRRELGLAVRQAMSDAVADCYANGDRDPTLVKARMIEMRNKVLRGG